MHVTMVKKRLASGEPCRKCAQAEELLKARGLWSRVDEVLWADENDAASPGMQLGARLGIGLAPFFVVRQEGGAETVFESVLQFAQFVQDAKATATATPTATASATPMSDPGDSRLGERHGQGWAFGLWCGGLGDGHHVDPKVIPLPSAAAGLDSRHDGGGQGNGQGPNHH